MSELNAMRTKRSTLILRLGAFSRTLLAPRPAGHPPRDHLAIEIATLGVEIADLDEEIHRAETQAWLNPARSDASGTP